VVHPEAGNLGGGGFMLFRDAKGQARFLDFREKAPVAASRNMYIDAEGNVIKDASVIGYKAVAVPGSVAGLAYAHKKWGKLPLKQVMAAAIRLAKKGFRVNYADASHLHDPGLAQFPESHRIFQRNGNSISRMKSCANLNWQRRWSGSPKIHKTSIVAKSPSSSWPTCRKTAASSPPRTWLPTK
jgi:gamma-glutamyltranspeptidase